MDWIMSILGHWICLSIGAMCGILVMGILHASRISDLHRELFREQLRDR